MENTETENKKGLLQNDRLLVCGMLVFYGLCIIGLAGGAFWWLNQRSQALSASATSTAVVISTEQARGTATAIARATELAQYELIDGFDSNANDWLIGTQDNEYWKGSIQITEGVYRWQVQEVKQGFVYWADFPGNDYIKNYDVYVDIKFEQVSTGKVCSGLIFRKAYLGWDTGGYSFVVCEAGFFSVYYHNYENGWQQIDSEYHPSIRPRDWNRLEVLVSDSHFVFLINNQIVYETEDDRQVSGGVALVIDADKPETEILFDNFGYQSH